MESRFLFAVIIVSPFSCFLLTCSYGIALEPAVDIEVIGNHTLRSGVRQYTLYGNSSKLERIECKIRNYTYRVKEVTILKNGKVKSEESVYDADDDRANDSGNYACRVTFEMTEKRFTAQYTVEMEVEVVAARKDSYIIASDVGSRVYKGEQISIFCNGFYELDEIADNYESLSYTLPPDTKVECPVFLIGDPSPIIEIPFDNFQTNVTCDLRQFRVDPDNIHNLHRPEDSLCSKPIKLDLTVVPELSLNLSLPFFEDHSKKLTFVCTSDPPRLMYWTVLTTDNLEIIDMEDPLAISSNTNISIIQKSGISKIEIQIDGEDDNDDNGIEAVICSTYDTKAHVIKTAQRKLQDQYNVSLANKVTGVSLTLIIVLSVFVIVLVLVVIFLARRMHQIMALSLKSPDGSNDGDDKVPSETELHDNPAYLPYEGTDDVSP